MGLAAIVEAEFKADPFSGVIYVFRSKRADRIKLLFWDGTGICLLIKRLEDGKFRLPTIEDGVMRLSPAQLSALLRGAGVDPGPCTAGSAAHGDAITCRAKSAILAETAAQISETAVMIAALPDALPNDVDRSGARLNSRRLCVRMGALRTCRLQAPPR